MKSMSEWFKGICDTAVVAESDLDYEPEQELENSHEVPIVNLNDSAPEARAVYQYATELERLARFQMVEAGFVKEKEAKELRDEAVRYTMRSKMLFMCLALYIKDEFEGWEGDRVLALRKNFTVTGIDYKGKIEDAHKQFMRGLGLRFFGNEQDSDQNPFGGLNG